VLIKTVKVKLKGALGKYMSYFRNMVPSEDQDGDLQKITRGPPMGQWQRVMFVPFPVNDVKDPIFIEDMPRAHSYPSK